MTTNNHKEASDLDKVLAGQPDHEAERLRELWALAGKGPPTDFPDPAAIETIWQKLEAYTEPQQAGEAQGRTDRVPLRRIRIRPWMAMAASVLVAATVGVWALWLRPLVETAAPGERVTLMLPDGSQVELNSGATVRYAQRFDEERVVHLDGEAFFDVAKAEEPFLVHTFNAKVQVLGTRFNVRAWDQGMDAATTVTLEEGRVALAPSESPEQMVTLTPGQTLRIAAEEHAPSAPDSMAVVRALAWRQGDLFYKDQRSMTQS